VTRRRLDELVRAIRINLPEIDGGADRAIESNIAVAATGKPLILFRCQTMAARIERRRIVSEAFQVHPLGRKTGLDGRPRGTPDWHAPIQD
jgi:hypothetical protein